jgi:hypothetical protein
MTNAFMDLTGFPTYKLSDGRTVLAPTNSKAPYEIVPGKFMETGVYWQQVQEAYLGLSYGNLKTVNQNAVWEMAQLYVKNALTPMKMDTILRRYGLNPTQIMNLSGGGGGSGVNTADQVRTLSALINDMAAQFGIPFTPEQITNLAAIAQKQNWSREQLVDELTKDVDWYKLNTGTIKTSYESYKTIGKQFLVNLSDQSAKDWALRVAKGEMTEETVLQSIRESAKTANPWLAEFIDRGLNPIDVLAPNRDFIAQNLELNPNDLDLMDQKTLGLMTAVGPDGNRKLADQGQMIKSVRTDERWKKTNNAKDLTAGMASLLSKIFGRSVF